MIFGLRFIPHRKGRRLFCFPMKKDIIKNVLLSLALHGILLACCFALPAQKLMPMFQAGNSSLTLTSLSFSSSAEEQPVEHESRLEAETDETENPDDLRIVAEKKPEPPAPRKQKNQKASIDADARTKGIAAGLSGNAGIRPYYPLGARLRGEEGVVKVEACLGPDGRVLNCAVVKSSGYAALDEAALDAVKRVHFISAKCQTIKNESKTVLTFRFDIVD